MFLMMLSVTIQVNLFSSAFMPLFGIKRFLRERLAESTIILNIELNVIITGIRKRVTKKRVRSITEAQERETAEKSSNSSR